MLLIPYARQQSALAISTILKISQRPARNLRGIKIIIEQAHELRSSPSSLLYYLAKLGMFLRDWTKLVIVFFTYAYILP